MEFDRRATVARFFAADGVALGSAVTVGTEAAHHMRVRRLTFGARVGLVDGAGRMAAGTLVRLGRFDAQVAVDEAWTVERPRAVHMIVPVADRDRMLWLAEKCVELGATSWQPVVWRRSASVGPRGTGQTFRDKVRARMIAALEQSGGAWLPDQREEISLASAVAAAARGLRVLLDRRGTPLLEVLRGSVDGTPITLAVGPEGGIEQPEAALLDASGFVRAAVGGTILRFETAAVAALATVRAALAAQ